MAAREKNNGASGGAACGNTANIQCSITSSPLPPATSEFSSIIPAKNGSHDDGGSHQQEEGKGAAGKAGSADSSGERRVNPRFRSESCADELLAAGRVTSHEAFGCSARAGVDEAESNASTSGGLAGTAGNSCVPRSHSFDLGTRGGNLRASIDEEFSRRKVRAGRYKSSQAYCMVYLSEALVETAPVAALPQPNPQERKK